MLEGSNYTIVKARTNKKVACVYINDQCIFICYINFRVCGINVQSSFTSSGAWSYLLVQKFEMVIIFTAWIHAFVKSHGQQ